MGSLILPPNGPIYLDTSGFIYSVERIEPSRKAVDRRLGRPEKTGLESKSG